MMPQKIEFIHHNSVKAVFVDNIIDWRYSLARNYVGLEELIGIDMLTVGLLEAELPKGVSHLRCGTRLYYIFT